MKEIFDLTFVIFFIYLIPLGLFLHYTSDYLKVYIRIPLAILYLILSFLTINNNLMPFIFILITIYLMRKISLRGYNYLSGPEDYNRYNFSIKTFDSLEGIKYAGMTLGITLIINIITQVIFDYFRIPYEEQDIVKFLRDMSDYYFIMMAVSALIIAPIVEEMIFRWFLFEKFFKKWTNTILAAVLSSALFSAGHMTLSGFLPIFALALINCYMIDKKGYWYAVFNHFFFNFLSFFSIFIQRYGSNFIK